MYRYPLLYINAGRIIEIHLLVRFWAFLFEREVYEELVCNVVSYC